jgi:hypothetical protein
MQSVAGEVRPTEPPDFDTRPGEPLRSTLGSWMQRCPVCGYCAEDIRSIHEHGEAVVRSSGYAAQLSDVTYPEKAREFLAHALILDALGQLADAGWTALHAAWICDDEPALEAATAARLRSLDYWKRGKAMKQSFGEDLALEFAIVADLCRRTGQFEATVVTCSEALDTVELTPLMEAILRREKSLAERKDDDVHSLRELPGFNR